MLSNDMNRIMKSGLRPQKTFFHLFEILLLFPVVGLVCWVQLNLVWMVHLHFHPTDLSFSQIMRSQDYKQYSAGRDIRLLLMFVPGFFGSMPLVMLFFNYVELSIAKLKQLALRSLEKSNIPADDVMGTMVEVVLLVTPICLFLEFLGAII